MQQQNNLSHGLKWGIIIGVAYIALLYIRYSTSATNPIMLGLWTLLGFLVVMGLLLACGFSLRKMNGGNLELKEAFKVLFLAVLIFELFYAVFNFIYLKYVNPDFFRVLKENTALLLQKTSQPQSKSDEMLKNIDENAGRNMNIFDVLKSYLFSISVSGMCALLIATIVKKKGSPDGVQPDKSL